MRVAIYLSVSTDRQTVENQRAEVLEEAAARGWEVAEEYAGILGAVGEFERELREHIRAGVARAKRAPRPGKRRPGRPRTAKVDLARARELLATGGNLSAVARELGASRGALRHRLAVGGG